MKKKTELSKLEKIVLEHFAIYKDMTWTELFTLVRNTERIKPENMPSQVSKYKSSEPVQNYLKLAETKRDERIKAEINKLSVMNEKGERVFLQDEQINFTNLPEFISYLNGKANTLTDEKERQKYLQMLSDLLRFKDQDTQDNDIIRFYMPIKCSNCPKNSQ